MSNNQNSYADMTSAEKEVAEYLKEIKIWWQFEHPVFVYDERDRPRVWTPDFYLPELGIYVEVCGSEEFDYEYRFKIYQKNRISIIFIHNYKNPKDWKKHLRDKMNDIHKYRWKLVREI
jgi:hypothetical protein